MRLIFFSQTIPSVRVFIKETFLVFYESPKVSSLYRLRKIPQLRKRERQRESWETLAVTSTRLKYNLSTGFMCVSLGHFPTSRQTRECVRWCVRVQDVTNSSDTLPSNSNKNFMSDLFYLLLSSWIHANTVPTFVKWTINQNVHNLLYLSDGHRNNQFICKTTYNTN